MLLTDLPDYAKNIQNPTEAIVFAGIVIATLESDITGGTTKDFAARQTLGLARQLLTAKLTQIETTDTESP